MSPTITIEVYDRSCAAGDAYAAKHDGGEPKVAVTSCEGACIKGEVARRAANLVAHELAPERAVRLCHGAAFLLNQGRMRGLVERAELFIVVDGCGLACGTRLAQAAFPEKQSQLVVANTLYPCDERLFGVNEIPEREIEDLAHQVASHVVDSYLGEDAPCCEGEESAASCCECC